MPDKPESHIYEPLDDETLRELALARWRRNRVQDLPQGVSLVPHGRAASIYLRTGDRFVELDAELSGNPKFDMSIYTEPGIASWVDINTLAVHPTTREERQTVRSAIEEWLRARPATAWFS